LLPERAEAQADHKPFYKRLAQGAITTVFVLGLLATTSTMIAQPTPASNIESTETDTNISQPNPLTNSPLSPPCLCIFDVDRTITGKQDNTRDCPDNQIVSACPPHHDNIRCAENGIPDEAYGGGDLTLGHLAQHPSETFCSTCYVGVITVS
jgi:hypothetical protein